ncbi:hypothetical protein Tco_0497817 [Tanacetum coccineum]
MASLEFYDKHNMVAYLEKSEGSKGFHQIINFLTASHIKNALTECPTLYASPIEQFWQTVALSTTEDGVRGITTTIDRKVNVFVSEASIRRHLKLKDSDGISSLPTAEIFEQLALMGVKKLEQTIKTSQVRRRAKVVISDDEAAKEDPSNQGRSLIKELDLDAGISLVPLHVEDQGRFDETQISDQPEEQLGRLVSTADISTTSKLDSTAGVKAKDKGKAIMHESEPPKKIKKRVQARSKNNEGYDFESALELQMMCDEEIEVEVKLISSCIDRNQGGYKMSHFKGMSYEDIRPIFKRVYDQNQAFIPTVDLRFCDKKVIVQLEKKKEFIAKRKRARETLSEEVLEKKLEYVL